MIESHSIKIDSIAFEFDVSTMSRELIEGVVKGLEDDLAVNTDNIFN